jgi:hypothetical protein
MPYCICGYFRNLGSILLANRLCTQFLGIVAKSDGTYVIEFRTAAGESLAISIHGTEAAVIRHFQERMPYGLFVPDVDSGVE